MSTVCVCVCVCVLMYCSGIGGKRSLLHCTESDRASRQTLHYGRLTATSVGYTLRKGEESDMSAFLC